MDGCAARQPAGGPPMTEPRPGVDVEAPVVAPPQPDLEDALAVEEELWVDDSGEDYSGWHCVPHRPVALPGRGLRLRRRLPHGGPPHHRLARGRRPRPAAPRRRRPRRGPQPEGRRLRAGLRPGLLATTSGTPPATRCTPSARTSAATSTRRREGGRRVPWRSAPPRPPARSPRPRRAGAAPSLDDARLGPDGLGPVRIGMTVAQARAATSTRLRIGQRNGDCAVLAQAGPLRRRLLPRHRGRHPAGHDRVDPVGEHVRPHDQGDPPRLAREPGAARLRPAVLRRAGRQLRRARAGLPAAAGRSRRRGASPSSWPRWAAAGPASSAR